MFNKMTNDHPTWMNDMIKALASPNLDGVDFAKALAIKDEHIPDRLYRYRAASERDWDNLRNGKMWMSAANKYNDPFDSGITVDWPSLKIAGVKKMIRGATHPWLDDQLRQQLLDNPNPTMEYFELRVSGGATPTDHHKSLARQVIEKLDSTSPAPGNPTSSLQPIVHVCSLAASGRSLLMWSHYASQHEGFCVEYDFGRLPKGDPNRNRLYPVHYNARRFDSSAHLSAAFIEAKEINATFLLLACLHKSPEWSYEQEWRLIEYSSDVTLAGSTTSMPAPSRIYLGARISSENEAKAVAVCTDLGIPLSKMKLSDSEYRLEPTNLS